MGLYVDRWELVLLQCERQFFTIAMLPNTWNKVLYTLTYSLLFFFSGADARFHLTSRSRGCVGVVFSKCHKIESFRSFKRAISWCKAQSWQEFGSVGLLETYEKGTAMPLLPDTLYSFGGFISSVCCGSLLVFLRPPFSFLSLWCSPAFPRLKIIIFWCYNMPIMSHMSF